MLSPLALAQETKPDAPTPKPESASHFNRKVFIAGVSLLAASKTADAIKTRLLLDRGGRENNPVFGRYPSPTKQAGINLAFFAAESTVFYATEHNRHKWVRWAGRAFIGHAIEEHSRLAVCNAEINVRSTVAQNCGAF